MNRGLGFFSNWWGSRFNSGYLLCRLHNHRPLWLRHRLLFNGDCPIKFRILNDRLWHLLPRRWMHLLYLLCPAYLTWRAYRVQHYLEWLLWVLSSLHYRLCDRRIRLLVAGFLLEIPSIELQILVSLILMMIFGYLRRLL